MATSRLPGHTSSRRPMDIGGTANARRRPVAGRAGGPDSGSGEEGTDVIPVSVPHPPPPGRVASPGQENGPGPPRRAGCAPSSYPPGGDGLDDRAPPRVTGVAEAAATTERG